MSSTASWRTFGSALAGALLAGAGCASLATGELIHEDDFRNGLGHWHIEAEKPGNIRAADGVLDIEVPANSEIILEGTVDPTERRREGPFGDHTGYYSLEDDFPDFHVKTVTHRAKPVYHTTIVGPPPQEDGFIGYAIERLMHPLMKMQIPELVDYHMPMEGVFHNLMIVSIE